MMGAAALLALLLLSPPPPPEATRETILALERSFTAGLVERNEAAFGRLLAEDLIHVGFEGQIAGKTEYMAFFKTGGWRYTRYEPSQVTVKLLGGAAVVTGRVDRVIVIGDHETKGAVAFTHVWSRLADGWRLTSSHLTTVAAPAR